MCCSFVVSFDVVIRGGMVYDGTGALGINADVAINGDSIAQVGFPHRYALGMRHVFVNGAHVLRDGAHTGTFAGRALTGPGRR